MYNKKTLKKFNEDKSVRNFPGSTIIQNISDPELLDLITKIKNEYLRHAFSEKLVFLPESSYHMTVASLLTYNYPEDNAWISEMPDVPATVEGFDEYCISLLQDEYKLLNIRMAVSGFNENKIILVPKTREDRKQIDAYRKRILEKIGIRFDKEYQFHISLNYTLVNLEKNDLAELSVFIKSLEEKYPALFDDIMIDSPTLALFDDMNSYWDFKMGRKPIEYSG